MTETWRAPEYVWAGALALALAASAAIVASPAPASTADAQSDAHAAVGGLGLGRTTVLGRCPAAFDPRGAGSCALRHHPIPATDALCGDHVLAPLGGSR